MASEREKVDLRDMASWCRARAGNASGSYVERYTSLAEIVEQLDALLSSQLESGWQPITPPPKDAGVYIVTYRVTFHRGSFAAKTETEHRVIPLYWDGQWNCLNGEGRTGFAYEVTHWMPLPAPPTREAERSQR